MSTRFYIIPAAIILFILFFTVFGERGVLRIYRLAQEKEEIQKKAAQIKTENEQLKREIEALKSDRRYLESIARKEFGLVRPNEIIYQFSPKVATEQKTPVTPPRSSAHP
jgi:cell division protein FtsB